MPTTPTFGLPYPSSSQPANVPYDLQQLAEATEEALQAEEWVLVPAASGYTSSLYARLENNGTVRLRGSIAKDTGTLSRLTTIATLATAYRPYSNSRPFATLGQGTTTPNTTPLYIVTAGTIQLLADNTTLGTSNTVYFDGVTFQTDNPTP